MIMVSRIMRINHDVDNGDLGERDDRGRQPVGAGRGVFHQAGSRSKGDTFIK